MKLEVLLAAMEEMDTSVQDGTLTIMGDNKQERKIREEDYYHRVRSYGSFR